MTLTIAFVTAALALTVQIIPPPRIPSDHPGFNMEAHPILEPHTAAFKTFEEKQLKPISPKDYVKLEASKHGWGEGQEWESLHTLIANESGWNPYVHNKRGSGACGLFQALPCSKLGAPLDNVANQARWGINYVKDRYGSPSKALAQWKSRCGSRKGCWY